MTDLIALHSDEASLVLETRKGAAPAWRHCGARVDVTALPPLSQTRGPASFSLDRDVPFSLAAPTGLGWFGPPMVQVRADGTLLAFLPTTSDSQADAERIHAVHADTINGLVLEQTITCLPGSAFRIEARLTNTGTRAVSIDWLASAQLPLAADSKGILSWRGRHNSELNACHEPMPQQAWVREGRRGISGHGGPPGLVVLGHDATMHSGLVHSLQLAWSGDSRLAVERDDEGYWILSAGAVLQPGEVVLAPGESWQTPAAYLAVSTRGQNGAMAQQHAAMRQLIRWPGDAMPPRLVHLNSWEACYFDHDEIRIRALAKAAADAGTERFVLDDGWFRARNDDHAGLGDWTTDPIKYPQGLRPLADYVVSLGMQFGLWVEPEMVNPDSDLYRAHPDWALHLQGRDHPTARNQLVLDMRLPQVRDYLFDALSHLLTELPISYLKWDHNRDLAPAGGARQVLGTYDLLARLRAAHPNVEIEGCAGGGGRSDAGLLPYVHRFWTSDTIDAVSRIGMQRGFLSFLPPEIMGSHIGASPSHATGRQQGMAFRAAVATTGHLGVELDPRAMNAADQAELHRWIAFYRKWRRILHGGAVHLGEGADGLVWQAHGKDGEWLVYAMRSQPPQNRRAQPLRLPFAAGSDWQVHLLDIAEGGAGHYPPQSAFIESLLASPQTLDGNWLAANGLPMPAQRGESVAIYHMRHT